MHAYDHPHDQSYRSLPFLSPPRSFAQSSQTTPIYDALYAEWVDSFRTTPGDRSGEGALVPAAFGSNPHNASPVAADAHEPYGNSHNAYDVKGYGTHNSAGREGHWQRVASLGQHSPEMRHIPAELPPRESFDRRTARSASAHETSFGDGLRMASVVPPTWPPLSVPAQV
ncbi:hypothetical protein ABIE67_010047 [Streptomyces sp. V4I8]